MELLELNNIPEIKNLLVGLRSIFELTETCSPKNREKRRKKNE